MDQRQRRRFQDVSKLGHPALQFSNQSGQHHRSVVHLSSAIAVRAVPKSAGYREIWWNTMKQHNFVAHLTGWVTCGLIDLIDLRFGEIHPVNRVVTVLRRDSRFGSNFPLKFVGSRDKLLPSEEEKGQASLGLRWDSFPTSFLHFSRLARVGSFSEAKNQHEPTWTNPGKKLWESAESEANFCHCPSARPPWSCWQPYH